MFILVKCYSLKQTFNFNHSISKVRLCYLNKIHLIYFNLSLVKWTKNGLNASLIEVLFYSNFLIEL